MNLFIILFSVITGIALSIIYFGGLWYTVKYIERLRRPYLLFMFSFLARNAIVLIAFYYLMIHHWSYLITAFAAFIITRQIIITRTKNSREISYG